MKPREAEHLRAEMDDIMKLVLALPTECFKRTNDPREEALRRTYVYTRIAKRLDRHIDAMKKELIRSGVTFDSKKQPHPVTAGEWVTYYDGTDVEVKLLVAEPGQRLDKDELVEAMHRAKLKPELINKIIGEATVENRPAHKWDFQLKGVPVQDS